MFFLEDKDISVLICFEGVSNVMFDAAINLTYFPSFQKFKKKEITKKFLFFLFIYKKFYLKKK